MNPADLSHALLYGIPVALYAGMYGGFDSILTRRECWSQPDAPLRTKEPRRLAVARDDDPPLHIAMSSTGIATRVAEFASSRALRWRSMLTRKPCSLRFFISPMPWGARCTM